MLGSLPVIGPHLPKVAVHGRIRPQWEIEKEVFAKLRSIPDVRITKLNDRGDRDLTYNFLSRNEKDLNEAVGILEAKLRTDPALANVGRRRRPAAARAANLSAQGRGSSPRHHAAADFRHGARGDHRRYRRLACQDFA